MRLPIRGHSVTNTKLVRMNILTTSFFRKGRSNAGKNTIYQFQSLHIHMPLQNKLFNLCMPRSNSSIGNDLYYLTLVLSDT